VNGLLRIRGIAQYALYKFTIYLLTYDVNCMYTLPFVAMMLTL